jgi:UMF1 family MFS transporter
MGGPFGQGYDRGRVIPPIENRTAVTVIKNDRRTIFGWTMYDWANSAYSTVIAGAVLPSYFASEVVGEGGWNGRSGQTLWSLAVGLGTLMVFLVMPVIGAIADFSASKLRFLRVFAYGGSLFTTALIFAVSGNVLYTLGFFMLAQVGFVGANVLYDGFLTDISTPDTIDRVSSRGYATGYIGGGLYLLIVVLAIQFAPDGALAARLGVAATGLWWAGFSAFAFSRLKESGEAETLPDVVKVPRALVRGLIGLVALLVGGAVALVIAFNAADDPVWFDLLLGVFMVGIIVTVVMIANRMNRPSEGHVVARRRFAKMAGIGFVRTFATASKLRAFPQLLLFVLAFMLYNDGVQTTINVSAAYATDTLGLETADIALTFLVVQFVAFGGALLFNWLSARLNIRRAIQIDLVVWVIVAIIAYFLPEGEPLPFILTGVAIGVVLGGVQALSRSLYGSMIPEQASAEFYGFYSVFAKFSAVWGPLIFSIVSSNSASGRPAILSLILFFAVGLFLFSRVDIDAARRSKDQWEFHGADAGLVGD